MSEENKVEYETAVKRHKFEGGTMVVSPGFVLYVVVKLNDFKYSIMSLGDGQCYCEFKEKHELFNMLRDGGWTIKGKGGIKVKFK